MKNQPWAELLQLVPTITLALPFILEGKVDIGAARNGFVVAAVLSLVVGVVIHFARQPQNPIALGAALWFWFGSVAFLVPVQTAIAWLEESQATGLFLGALLVGTLATFRWESGYLATRGSGPSWTRRGSLILLSVNVACLIWAWVWRHDVRIGGGIPFIVLNATRRMLGLRTAKPDTKPAG